MQSHVVGNREHAQRSGQASSLAQRSASYAAWSRTTDSWIEVASQPSSSSLSSVADEIVTTGLRVQQDPSARRKRRARHGALTDLDLGHRPSSINGASSQEEYEESESESDRVMTSSSEGLPLPAYSSPHILVSAPRSSASDAATDDEDENRTAVNYPIHNEHCFTPLPNAFSHPPGSHNSRTASQSVPGSYFPGPAARPVGRPSPRHSYPSHQDSRPQHSPYNMLSPSHDAAATHDAALRASLSTLLSCAAAARGLPKSGQRSTSSPMPMPSERVQPSTLRMVPESELLGTSPPAPQQEEPTFRPTIRRHSTSTSASAEDRHAVKEGKRKGAAGRTSSKDRRAVKKARRTSNTSYSYDDLFVSPTVLTWVVSAGVVVALSALSFSAGYSMGKEAGRFEAGLGGSGGEAGGCAREAGRSGLGLRRLRFTTTA